MSTFSPEQQEEINLIVNERIDLRSNLLIHAFELFYDLSHFLSGFEINRSEFCIYNAYCLTRLSALAYRDKKYIAMEIERCYDKPSDFSLDFVENDKFHVSCFIVTDVNSIIVSFRGTETKNINRQLRNIITDVNFTKVNFSPSFKLTEGSLENIIAKGTPQDIATKLMPIKNQGFATKQDLLEELKGTLGEEAARRYKSTIRRQTKFSNGKVHKGFLEALDSIWDILSTHLGKKYSPSKKLWFTGHSMGGALATLALAKLMFNQDSDRPPYNIGGLYTVGQPKVGDNLFSDKFSEQVEGRAFRLVQGRDPVSMAPLGYKHTPELVYLVKDGTFILEHQEGTVFKKRMRQMMTYISLEALKLLITQIVPGIKLKYENFFSDHSILKYVENIKECKEVAHQDSQSSVGS